MPPLARRGALRVRDGRVQKKNNWTFTERPDSIDPAVLPIQRRDPGVHYRHVLTVRQLRDFIALLPDWEEIAVGLRTLILAEGTWDTMGWYRAGHVALNAWERELWWSGDPAWVAANAHMLDLLDVDRVGEGDDLEIRWTENQARAFMLLDVLPHELGHHHDRMTTRSRASIARGEPYAEEYARQALDAIWPRYTRHFEL